MADIKKIESEINPDLVHIWGTENYWGMLLAKEIIKKPAVLDMQGILHACAQVYYGGLSNKELVQCIGLKEMLLPQLLLYFRKKNFETRVIIEKQINGHIENISVQSEWVQAHVLSLQENGNIFNTGIILRKEFYLAPAWEQKKIEKPIIFSSSSGAIPYKGIHVLFRAIALLKKKYPDIQLHIAGKIEQRKLRQDGYTRWILKEATRLKILNNIKWLGALDANGIIEQFHVSSVVVVPSYVETYCLAFAEAMMVGVPTVASYAGAMPELAKHQESTLFFPVGDHTSCAYQIEKLLESKSLSQQISNNARAVGLKRNDPQTVVTQQLKIYEEILQKSNSRHD